MHYKRRSYVTMKSHDFIRRYLYTANQRMMTSPVGKIR